ncbi:acetate--CoA ligase family protein [Desulfosporosinus sp.]|uniref:acetate--CoA ligase family protein n=1 Tax=Desulfosporosinus sp. TaxID=157907 RepID=UPI0023132F94|nr:acetate--CoA ligase family protein [Desulfosporosinus sp.]MCO5387848.1 acetate--CoA ligase family protein [Desulfosporosinus sp.]MDA8224109.1 acetate--CoA ligase family protein [Desulfitobacterium hafniense]
MYYFMEPTGVAIIGASQDFKTINGKILKYLLKHKYQGQIYPVNPKYREIEGLPCYPSVDAIPEQVDLALIAVAAARVPGILRDCGTKKIKRAVIFSSGFSETGSEGKKIQEEIIKIAQEFQMRLIGPNCLGVLNVSTGLIASFSASMELDSIKEGPVALVSQSGAVGFLLFNLLQDAGVGVNYVITTGNEADVTVSEGLAYLVENPSTKVILTYLEGLRDGETFKRTIEKAAEAGKPIIALKVGNSASGQKAAATHTAALTGSGAAYKSYFDKMGIIEAKDSDDIIDLAQAFVPGKLPKGARLGIVTMSGGVGILLADRLEEVGLQVPQLSEALQEEVRKVIPAFGCAQNPVDVTAQSLNEGEEFKKCLKILLESDELDMLIVAITMATGKLAEKIGRDVAEAALETDKPLVVCWSVGQVAKPGFDVLKDAGIPLYHSPARAAKVMGVLYNYARFKNSWKITVAEKINISRQTKVQNALKESNKALSEHATKELLELYGLPVTKEYVAKSAEEAVAIAEKMGYPVVMKIDSPDILHKTEAGGVAVNINSAQSVEATFNEIMKKALNYNPQADINGILMQEQVPAGVEAIIGLQRDPVLGTQIMFGLGGIFVEVFKDIVLKPAPLSREDALEVLNQIKGGALLNGVRGGQPADKEALVEILLGVSQLAVEAGEDLLSLDINPVTVLPQGQGAKILDGVLVSSGLDNN